MHTAKGTPWPKSSHSLYDHVAGLPLSLLETDGMGEGYVTTFTSHVTFLPIHVGIVL